MWRVSSPSLSVKVDTELAAVITVPILMLWNVHISWKKKLALIGLFSLTIIVIIFSIVRVAVVTSRKSQADVTWLYMLSNIEMAGCTSTHLIPEYSSTLTKYPTPERL